MSVATLVHQTGQLKIAADGGEVDGDVKVIGSRIGVVGPLERATAAAEAGDLITVYTKDVYRMAAKSTDEWADGAQLYWDATNNELTDTAGSNKTAGLAVGAKTSGQTTAKCDINASASTVVIA